jgi:2-deoxy-D-gluconate 3-dehydrogenase
MESIIDLSGRTALVTGGSRGIGAGIGRSLALAGAHVILVGRGGDGLRASRAQIAADGGRADVLEWDIGNGDSAPDLMAAAGVDGRLDILVHAAGNQIRKPALEFSAADWDAIHDLHLRAAFLLAQAFTRRLVGDDQPADDPRGEDRGSSGPTDDQRGSIVFVGSLTSTRLGLPGIVGYAAAKSGLLGLTRTLAAEWATHGVRVNAVLPGFVSTELTRDVDDDPDRRAITMRAPQRRLGSPADVGSAAAFLASPAAGFITGESLTVDGGWSGA